MAACYATAPAVRAKAFLYRMGYVQTWRLSWYRRLRFQSSLTNKVWTVWSTDAYNRYLYCTFQSLINKYLNFYALYTGQPVGAAVPSWCFLFFKRIICRDLLPSTHQKAHNKELFAVSNSCQTLCWEHSGLCREYGAHDILPVFRSEVNLGLLIFIPPPTHTPQAFASVAAPVFLGLLTLLPQGDRHLYVDVYLLALSLVSLWSIGTKHGGRLKCWGKYRSQRGTN
jgi:hypothetical protein